MHYLLIRHRVEDYKKWRAEYDRHLPARQRAGLKEAHVLRDIENPHEVVVLFEVSDLAKAHQFAASSDLREAMNKAGVTDKVHIHFLDGPH
jgi:hypothetical protein